MKKLIDLIIQNKHLVDIIHKGYQARLTLALLAMGISAVDIRVATSIFSATCSGQPVQEWEKELRDTISDEGARYGQKRKKIRYAMRVAGLERTKKQ